jgi:hypothetical protein
LFVQNCIDSSIPFLRLTDSVGYALDLMQEFKCSSLAIVENNAYLGTIQETVLLELDDVLSLQIIEENFLQQYLQEGLHLFDVLKKSIENSTYFFAVINAEDEYIGLTTPQKILDTLVQHSSVTTTGGIIVLELEARNYSLAEISKIVESNNAMILQSNMAAFANQNYIQVSLKINKNDLKDIQLTFERYQYNVIAVYHQSEYEVQLKDRYDSLMRYLEV